MIGINNNYNPLHYMRCIPRTVTAPTFGSGLNPMYNIIGAKRMS